MQYAERQAGIFRVNCNVPLVLLALPLIILLVIALALPLSLVQRYRMGTARRRGRRWAARLNLIVLAFSCVFLVWVAAFTNFWAPHAFAFSLLGLLTGAVLGVLGLLLTKWEKSSSALHYTPNRWLILLLTFAVTARVFYGIWKAWHAWGASAGDTSWLAAAGVAGSMAVGAIVLGYYLIYTAGVYRRLRK